MKTWIMKARIIAAIGAMAILGAPMFAAPAQAAVSASLARQCREMMVKAHPLTAWATAPSAEAQRDYFRQCIKNQGKADEQPTTTPPLHGPV